MNEKSGHRSHAAWMDGVSQAPTPAPESESTRSIGMEARQVVKAIKVPTEGALTEEQRTKIRTAVLAHLKEHQITHAEAGLSVDRAASTISEVLKGCYKGDGDGVLRNLNQFMEDDERRRRAGRPHGFYATNVFTSVAVLAKFAKSNARTGSKRRTTADQDSSRITLGVGPAGIGKSAAAMALAADDPTAVLVRLERGGGGSTGVTVLTCNEIGEKPSLSPFHNLQKIKKRLTGSGRLLIVDEGHRLEPAGCEILRDFADVCGIPILILGTQEVSDRLTRVRTGAGNLLYDQFSRRVGMWLDLTRGVDGRGGTTRPIFSLDEIRAIFHSDEVKLSADGAEYLQACACVIGQGMLGFAQNAWNKARRAAIRRGGLIDAARLRDAAGSNLSAAGVEAEIFLQRIDEQLKKHRMMRAAG